MIHCSTACTTLATPIFRHDTQNDQSYETCSARCHQRKTFLASQQDQERRRGSGAVVVAEPPWKQSKRQGLEKDIAAVGEDKLQGLVSQSKEAT